MIEASTVPEFAATTLAPRQRSMILRRLVAHRSFQIGFFLVGVLAIAAVLGPMLTNTKPSAMHISHRFSPPQAKFLFGTDMFGRDIFTRVLYGARVSLWVGFAVAAIAGVFGTTLGVLAAQFRSLEGAIMRLMDALMSFPAILLALGITAALGPSMNSVIIALSVAYVPPGVRIVRASALVVRELDYVQAALIAGARAPRIMLRHILPNSIGPLLVHLSFVFAYAILAEAALSFLGVGVQPPTPSWGNIIAEGRDYALQAWWIVLFPGIGISLATIGLNLLGDGLRDVLDPKLKG
ncbi:ABC transporter permease [Acidisoma cellulosilytica]|uniref:ABC transporter permease n=1 Tax=Acidisoma cellulosilyticum TaxID=2802395 RepID=A0A964E6P4_9PROT|nr:ABC transporter permease [Acidisoma cellulosilyticum]MCB8883799.1 ABC transporter permease [Acidisoma cellulosilyticum]